MKSLLIVIFLFGIAAHVSQVNAVKCSTDAECTATDNTMAKCVKEECQCQPQFKATEEGCAKPIPKPTLSLNNMAEAVIKGSKPKLTCIGQDAGTEYAWYKKGEADAIKGATKKDYIPDTFDKDATYSCQVIFKDVPTLNSEKSDEVEIKYLESGEYDKKPTLTLSSSKVAKDKEFTVKCADYPFGATAKIQAGGIDVVGQKVKQVAEPKDKKITCELSAPGITFKKTEVDYPAIATEVDKATITVHDGIAIEPIVAYKTSNAPKLTCTTSPEVEYLKQDPDYTWKTGSKAATFQVPKEKKTYDDFTCQASKKTSESVKIIVDDDYVKEPKITQKPEKPKKSGSVTFTCDSETKDVVYSWLKDGKAVPNQNDKTIQYTKLTPDDKSKFVCKATKDGFTRKSPEKKLSVSGGVGQIVGSVVLVLAATSISRLF